MPSDTHPTESLKHPAVHAFLIEHGLKYVVNVGGSARIDMGDVEPDVGESLTRSRQLHHDSVVRELIRGLAGYPIAVGCGGTKGGVPELVAKYGHEYKVRVIGVMPDRGSHKAADGLSLRVVVPPQQGAESCWGDESPVWAGMADAVCFVGGSAGSLVEFALLAKRNEMRLDRQQAPVHITSIHGTGGLADEIHRLPMPSSVRRLALPAIPLRSGTAVAEYLINSLFPAD